MAREESGLKLGLSVLRGAGRLGALLALCSTACTEPVETVELRVATWWSRTSEELAFDYVIRAHQDAHENVRIVNFVDSEADDARDVFARKLLAGSPPATFQANIGADLLRWTAVDTEDGSRFRVLQGLAALFEKKGLNRVLPEDLLQALRVGTSSVPYGVPINIHRANLLYYNQASLDAFVAAHGASFLEFETLCPDDPGPEDRFPASIAVGGAGWELVLLALENVLPAVAGATFYDQLMRGEEPEMPAGEDWRATLAEALGCVEYLSRSFVRAQNWAEAVDAVRPDGGADLTVMGDWAGGQLASELADGKVNVQPFPRTERYFVFTSDTFPLPVRAEHPDEVLKLLETVASEAIQIEFSNIKGSIPARMDARLSGRAAETRDAFQAAEARVLATSGRFPPYFDSGKLQRLLGTLTQPRNVVDPEAVQTSIAAVVDEIDHARELLAKWQTRLTQPAGDPL